MSDRPADPAGDGPTTGGPKPSIADVASWLRRAAEERDRTGDPGSREASTAGADGGTEAPTSTTTAADEPEAEDPTDRPPVPTDHGDGAPVEPVQERLDDQVVAEAAPAPEAPAAPRPTGPAVRPARDLWGRLLPSVVAAGTDDSAGQPQAGTSTSPGADEAQAASSGDAARTEDGQERLAATGPGDASGAGGDARSIEQTASSSDGTAADTIWVPPEPAADDLAAGRTSTADRPGSGVGSWAGGTQADRVAAGPSALPLADTPPKDSGGTPPSDAALGEAEAVDEGISEARGDQPLSPSVGLVPEDPVRDGGGDDPGEPVDLGGPGFVGLKQTAGAEDVTEATPGDQGQGRQEAGDGLDDDHPALDLVPTDRATADRGTEAVPPVDVVASPDDQDQSRQGPGIDDEPPTHLVPSDEGRGHAAPGSPEPVDVTGPATASVWSRDGTLDDQAQDRAIGSAPGGPAPRPDQPADKGAAVPDDRPAPDPPSPPEPSAAAGDPTPWTSPFGRDAARFAADGAAAAGTGTTGEAASGSLLGEEQRPEVGSDGVAEAEIAPVQADLGSTVDEDQERGPAAGTAVGDGRTAGQTPEALLPSDGATASAPIDLGQAPPAAPRLTGIWTRPAPPTPVDVEDDSADRDGQGDKATEQDGRGAQATMAPAGPTEVDELPSDASDDVDEPAGSEATASVTTLQAGEDGPLDPEWSARADGGIVTGDVEMDVDDDDADAAEPTPQSPVATALAELRQRRAAKRKRYPRGQLKERIGILQRVRAMLGVVLLTVILGVAAGAAIGAFLFFVAFAIRSAITSG